MNPDEQREEDDAVRAVKLVTTFGPPVSFLVVIGLVVLWVWRCG